MSRAKLRKAPLREVIFELMWELTSVTNTANTSIQVVTDPGYQLAIGSFAEKIKEAGLPVRKRVPPEGMRLMYQPEFQFWTQEATWPVMQLGPGIFTVNDTDKNYSWENNYVNNIKKGIDLLVKSYDSPLKFNKTRLQYVNVFPLSNRDAFEFIETEMRAKVVMESKFPGSPNAIGIQKSYVQQDGSVFSIEITHGVNNIWGTTGVVWTLTVELNQQINSTTEIMQWLERAHNLTSTTFHTMLKKEFYDSFDR